ncbi:MAG: glycosyltransferase [Parachlamydiaceae bacterium]|nr:glycosyltransferase [Parachlamydiaceae bacterium]
MTRYILATIFVASILNLNIIAVEDDPLQIRSESGWRSLSFNIICSANGVGQSKDFKILSSELQKLGHQVNHVNYPSLQANPVDINIFIEHFDPQLFPYAQKNCLIPNPEWYCNFLEYIPQFDLILCRTHEIERIFKEREGHTYFIGFTSCDNLRPEITKDYSQYFHLRGQSAAKGTDAIMKVWQERPDFPMMTITSHWKEYAPLHNLSLHQYIMSEQDLILLQNICGIHLLPSQTEGFGHSISEAMSCGAVVLTTNAPPMNEFVVHPDCLIDYYCTMPQRLAINYTVDPKKLEGCVENLCTYSNEELEIIGKENRQRYLRNKEFFQENLQQLFGSVTAQ